MQRLFRTITLICITLINSACYDFTIKSQSDGSADSTVDGARGSSEVDTSGNPISGDPSGVSDGGTPVGDDQADAVRSCDIGATRCDTKKVLVEVCTVSGDWTVKEECDSGCAEGVCSGVCMPGKKHCGRSQIPETCSEDGKWTPADKPCSYVCSGMGECKGECTPGSKRCSGSSKLTPQTCDEAGKWVASGSDCANVCSNGSCGGTCSPGTLQCGTNQTPEKCSDKGTWEYQKACTCVCSGDGKCAGSCKPNTKKCSGQAPLTCDETGEWTEDRECVDSACRDGNCIGSCSPGDLQCGSNETPQKCNLSGKWQSQSKCQFVCMDDGACGGVCKPNSKSCSGTTLKTCDSEGLSSEDKVCEPVNPGETATCGNNACKSSCVSPAKTCPNSKYPSYSSYCWNLEYGCDNCVNGTVFRSATKPWGCTDYICVSPDARSRRANENNTPHINNDTCESGYVRRMANSCDTHVCVTQAVRNEIVEENAAADSNRYVYSGAKPATP